MLLPPSFPRVFDIGDGEDRQFAQPLLQPLQRRHDIVRLFFVIRARRGLTPANDPVPLEPKQHIAVGLSPLPRDAKLRSRMQLVNDCLNFQRSHFVRNPWLGKFRAQERPALDFARRLPEAPA